jgi:ERCC4-type nuclease
MDVFEQRAVLESFQIIVDTREQNTAKAKKRYASFGVPFTRVTLSFGDYTYNCTLPDGSKLFDTSNTIRPLCAVERKMSLDELAMCFTRSRDRFRKEFERAAKNGSKMFLVCENSSYEGILQGRYKSKFSGKAFLASLIAWSVRYDVNVVFCKEESSGRLIKEILYRDLKERLERGEFG